MNINSGVGRYVDKAVDSIANFSNHDVFYRIAYEMSTVIFQ
jgi:hypothetical protein